MAVDLGAGRLYHVAFASLLVVTSRSLLVLTPDHIGVDGVWLTPGVLTERPKAG